MLIGGEATITKKVVNPDGSFGTVTEVGTFKNTITQRVWDQMFANNNDQEPFKEHPNRRIALSTQGGSESYNDQTLDQIVAVGDGGLVATPSLYTQKSNATERHEMLYTNRFLQPAAQRIFSRIGIVDGAVLVDDPSATTARNAWTQLVLTSSVTQEPIEIIDVSYRIFMDWQAGQINSSPLYELVVAGVMFDRNWRHGKPSSTFRMLGGESDNWTCGHFTDITTSDAQFTRGAYDTYISGSMTRFRRTAGAISINYDESPDGENEFYYTFAENAIRFEVGRISGDDILNLNCQGSIIRSILWATPFPVVPRPDNSGEYTLEYEDPVNGYQDWGGKFVMTKASNISNVFSHLGDNSNRSMYDANQLATSSLKPIITESVVTDDLPKHYFLNVETSGGIGVGTYKLFKDSFAGYPGNAYSTQLWEPFYVISSRTPYTYDDTQETILFNQRHVHEWSATQGNFQFVSYLKRGGIAIWEVTSTSTKQLHKFPLSTYTQFGSIINDIAVDPVNDKIYVATELGLYEIVVTGAIVTQLNSDACATVVVGNGATVWAIFRDLAGSGRLSSTLGGGLSVALDVTGATINWDNIWRMWIDPTSTNYELLFYEGMVPKNELWLAGGTINSSTSITNIVKTHWWDNVSNWIKTDQWDFRNRAGETASSTIHCSLEEWYLPNNDCVQVTNGVWIYPGDGMKAGSAINQNTDPRLGERFFNNNCGIDLDVLWEMARDGRRISSGTAWNSLVGSDIYSYAMMGVSKEWHFGKHGVAPFFSQEQDGSLCALVRGKPNPGDTVYDLNMLFGHHVYFEDLDVQDNGVNRMPWMLTLQVDELGTSTWVDLITDISGRYRQHRNNDIRYGHFNMARFFRNSLGDQFWFSNPTARRRTYSNDAAVVEPQTPPYAHHYDNNQRFDGGFGHLTMAFFPEQDTQMTWLEPYSWNGVSWVYDPLNTGPGKPAHLTDEALIDGMTIRWEELLPGNPQPLAAGEYYNFVKEMDPNGIFCETTAPNISLNMTMYYRAYNAETMAGTIPASAPVRIYVDQAPLGAFPDPLFFRLPTFVLGSEWSATINGSPATVLINGSTTPPAGTIHITNSGAGEIYFAAADSGLPYTLNYAWLQKFDATET